MLPNSGSFQSIVVCPHQRDCDICARQLLLIMKRTYLVLLAVAFLCTCSGCLLVGQFDYSISLNASRTKATAISIYRNIRGTTGDTAQTNIDFQELMEDWKGDAYVRDRAATGVNVTERSVYLEQGALCGRQVSAFTPETPGFASFFVSDTVRIAFKNADFDSIIATNGSVNRRWDSTIVWWKPGSTLFQVSLQIPTPGESVDLTEKFNQYLATQH
jgi:hypothetical protein